MFKQLFLTVLLTNLIGVTLCHYTDHWAVEIDVDPEEAKKIASQSGFQYVNQIMPGYYTFRQHRVMKKSLTPDHHHHTFLVQHPAVKWAEQQKAKVRVKRDLFNDPLWPQTWYLHNSKGDDMRVVKVYTRFNITGRGVKVSILDDGIEKNHPDLKDNYDAGSSFDVNDNDDDPQPTYDPTDENRHGTRCAGEVAAAANNSVCGVGVAYNSRIGGVRMLDGDVTDAVEASSLGLNPNHIDIYSVSWGPEDNGATVDGPGILARRAIEKGAITGRNGLGNIFVWASGNGGLKGDSCACDGYCNSIYTLTVSSATESGTVPWYSEPCSNTMASTYSSGSSGQRSIVTTDLRSRCTTQHTGTSATAPLVAGICALVLEANPRLTWRDMQYIVFLTARKGNLIANDWVTNGLGRNVSHHFGYGLMDASRMVELAFNWTTVPTQLNCSTPYNTLHENFTMEPNSQLKSSIVTDACQTTINSTNTTTTPDRKEGIWYLEHVECVVTLRAQRRGDVELILTSPSGTPSKLLVRRLSDTSINGFTDWSFMTTHSWGENPKGTWTLQVNTRNTNGVLKSWRLNFYGVRDRPLVYDKFLSSTPAHYEPEHTINPRFALHSEEKINCPPNSFTHLGLCVESCPLSYYQYEDRCESCLHKAPPPSHISNSHSIDCNQSNLESYNIRLPASSPFNQQGLHYLAFGLVLAVLGCGAVLFACFKYMQQSSSNNNNNARGGKYVRLGEDKVMDGSGDFNNLHMSHNGYRGLLSDEYVG